MDSPCYGDLLRTAARKTTAIYDRHLQAAGLTLAQFRLLKRLDKAGKVSITELATVAGLDRSTVGRNMQVLERHGLAATCDCADQRLSLLRLTDDGRAALERARPHWLAAQREIETRLGADGVAAVAGLAAVL